MTGSAHSTQPTPPTPRRRRFAKTTERLAAYFRPSNKQTFSRYQLLFRLASGGMANIYVGRLLGTAGFQKLVAVKIIHGHLAEDPEFVKMFIDEANISSRISHPNVVQIHELGLFQRHYFMVMEYVEGENLNALLRRTQPDYCCAARLIAEAAAGLHAAHTLCDERGQALEVVHRDIAPDNIIVGYNGTVKVVDFGIARARDAAHSTRPGTVKGRFSYMAPEQALGKPTDHRADIFSLGVVLYELVTRQRLFRGQTDAETLRAVLRAKVPPPSSVDPGVPPELDAIILTALSRSPDHRFQTAADLRLTLEGFLHKAGASVGPEEIAAMMSSHFADRVAQKRDTLQRAHEAPPQTGLPTLDGGTDPGLAALTSTMAQRQRGLLRGLVALALVAALVLVSYFAGRGRPVERGAQTSGVASAANPRRSPAEASPLLPARASSLVRAKASPSAPTAAPALAPTEAPALAATEPPAPTPTEPLAPTPTEPPAPTPTEPPRVAAAPREAHAAVVRRAVRQQAAAHRPPRGTKRHGAKRSSLKKSPPLKDETILVNPYDS